MSTMLSGVLKLMISHIEIGNKRIRYTNIPELTYMLC